jgi:predicted RNA-binding protein YlqC (UPF0109 family)
VSDAEVDVDDEHDDADELDDANEVSAATAADVLEYVVRALVDDPDAVEVDIDDRGRRTRLDVRVGPGDMGKVIGRRGRVAQSIRTVVRAAAVRDEVEVDIEFVD